jgi:hypothetical protein
VVHTVYCARSVEPIHDPNSDPVARRALYVPQKHAFSLGTTDVSATRQQPLETAEVFLSKRFTAIIAQTLAAAETRPAVPFVPPTKRPPPLRRPQTLRRFAVPGDISQFDYLIDKAAGAGRLPPIGIS